MNKVYKLVCCLAATLISVAAFAQKYGPNVQKGINALEEENYTEALKWFKAEIEESPKDVIPYILCGHTYFEVEEYGRSLSMYDAALKVVGKDKSSRSMIHRERSVVYLQLADTLKAYSDIEAAMKYAKGDDEEMSELFKRRAQLYYEQHRYSEADADYNAMLKIDPNNVMSIMGLGRNCNDQKDYAGAIAYFDKAIQLYPDYSSGYSFRAESNLGQKEYTKAADDLVKALSIDGDSKAFYTMQDFDADSVPFLLSRLKLQVVKEPKNYYWTYCIGHVYQTVLEDYAKAIGFYRKSLEINSSDVVYRRISECYDELGDFDMAIQSIEEASAIDKNNLYYSALMANYLYEAGRSDEAIAALDSYLEERPEASFWYYRRGWIKESSGDIEGALEDYTMCTMLDDEYAYAYLCRGRIYEKKGKTALAKADYEKVIELEPEPSKDACAQYAYFHLGLKDKAIEYMDKVIELDSKGGFYDAACLYSIMGEADKSLEYLRKALEHGYRSFHHIRVDDDLYNLRAEKAEEFESLLQEYEGIAAKEKEETSSGEYEEIVVEIPFTKEGSMCKVQCTINGLPLYFIFDTGASVVSISSVEANFMLKNDYLVRKDVVGRQQFINANGEISEGTIINLRKVDFGGLELTDIQASVVKNQSAPLLLGQTVLEKLGRIEIDNEHNILKVTYKKEK